MLTPVPFRKGRASLPRLSPLRMPGKRSEKHWTETEIAVVRDHYEQRGVAYCKTLLPRRSVTTIYQRAGLLGLKRSGSGLRAEPVGTSLDETIRARWPTMAGRGAVAALANELGVKRDAVSRRVMALGLTLPHKKQPAWSAAEEALLLKAPVHDPQAASAFFAAHGFKRTGTSITVHCKRRGVTTRRQDVLTGRDAARILGIDSKTVAGYCNDGLLVAARRGTARLPQQGGDQWAIRPADLRRFVVEHVDRLDIRKVDKHAFVALLTGALDLPDAATASPQGAAGA